MLDFEKFIQTAGELGLMVIVRPGPYICAEWDFGGMPAWLLEKNGMRFRCMNKPFLNAVDRFYGAILPRLKKLQCTEGGPIIAMQVENEYGSFGEDKNYLAHIRDLMVDNGISVELFTSDGPGDHVIQGGTLPDLLMTVNFGSNPEQAFKKAREYRPDGPDFCMEFWNGWFDHWGHEHHTRDAADAAKTLDEILGAGASVNFYMFHGGTNFGFWNGANEAEGKHLATVTSYDYDAPLNECGDPTENACAVSETSLRKSRSDRMRFAVRFAGPPVQKAPDTGTGADGAFQAEFRLHSLPHPLERARAGNGFALCRPA